MCLHPLRYPNSPVQFYSVINLNTPRSLRTIQYVGYLINYIIWVRVFIGFSTFARCIVINFLSALLLCLHFIKILPFHSGAKAIQQYNGLRIAFSIFCDLYGCYLLVFGICITPGLVRTNYYLIQNPELITMSGGLILALKAMSSTFGGLLALRVTCLLHTTSAKTIRSWGRKPPCYERNLLKRILKCCRPLTFKFVHAGLEVKRSSSGIVIITICRGTFRSVLTFGI